MKTPVNGMKSIKQSNSWTHSWTVPFIGFFALATALSLIAVSVFALGADRTGAKSVAEVAQPAAATETYTYPAAARPVLVYYLVDSPEQAQMADQVEMEASREAAVLTNAPARSYLIFQITTPEEEIAAQQSISATSYELDAGGAWDFAVVDLRHRSAPETMEPPAY